MDTRDNISELKMAACNDLTDKSESQPSLHGIDISIRSESMDGSSNNEQTTIDANKNRSDSAKESHSKDLCELLNSVANTNVLPQIGACVNEDKDAQVIPQTGKCVNEGNDTHVLPQRGANVNEHKDAQVIPHTGKCVNEGKDTHVLPQRGANVNEDKDAQVIPQTGKCVNESKDTHVLPQRGAIVNEGNDTQVMPQTGKCVNEDKDIHVSPQSGACVNEGQYSREDCQMVNNGCTSSTSSNTQICCVTEIVELTPAENTNNLQTRHIDDDTGVYLPNDIQEDINDEDVGPVDKDIPSMYWSTSLKCLYPKTIERLSLNLDIRDGTAECKDYRGLGELIGIEPIFLRYISEIEHQSGSNMCFKTQSVLQKWDSMEDAAHPDGKVPPWTIGQLRLFLLRDVGHGGISRPDAVTDVSELIVKDADIWERSKHEALTDRAKDEDKSWQLTRHDVVLGKKTYYTTCLCYADEDEWMARLIQDLYTAVYPGVKFFHPQFDLKRGKYEYETTAQVIKDRETLSQELREQLGILSLDAYELLNWQNHPEITTWRQTIITALGDYIIRTRDIKYRDWCNGNAIFILSEYFFASDVCKFTVNYTRAIKRGDDGKLVPLHLTDKIGHVPNVLKGIAGIRWYRRSARAHSWQMLTECLLEGVHEHVLQRAMDDIKSKIEENSSKWCGEPQYDESTPPPGKPVDVYDPPVPSRNDPNEFDNAQSEDSNLATARPKVRTRFGKSMTSKLRSAKSAVAKFFNKNVSVNSVQGISDGASLVQPLIQGDEHSIQVDSRSNLQQNDDTTTIYQRENVALNEGEVEVAEEMTDVATPSSTDTSIEDDDNGDVQPNGHVANAADSNVVHLSGGGNGLPSREAGNGSPSCEGGNGLLSREAEEHDEHDEGFVLL